MIRNSLSAPIKTEDPDTAVYALLICAETPEYQRIALRTINTYFLLLDGLTPRTKKEILKDPLYKRAVLEVEQSLDAKCRRFNSRIDKIVEENRK